MVEEVATQTAEEEELEAETRNSNDTIASFMQNDSGELFQSNVLSFNSIPLDNDHIDFVEDETSFFENGEIFDDENDDLLDLNSPAKANIETTDTEFVLPPQRRCLAHLLNLIAGDFDKALAGMTKSALIAAINKLHAIWVYTSRSSLANSITKEVMGCKFLVPVVTRWNSKFDAIAKSCEPEIKSKVNFLIQRFSAELKRAEHLQIVTNNDWAVLNDYLKVMKPVAVALDKLQGD